jgi:serine/threonine protein kinase
MGEAMGLVFRAMRLAENGSLRDHLAAGPQSPFYEAHRAILLFQEIVEGLEFIHSQGYPHGNLTPSNILLDAMLHPLLSDFGLPGRIGGEVSPYLAPEQVQGGMVDRRADVYALGVLLYTTLVGAEPPAGVVVSPRSRRPDLPEGVERVIFKAMAQNPDQRFQTATEFFNAMRAAFVTPAPASQPVYAPTPVAPVPVVSQTVTVGGQKRGTNWVAIILGVFVVLALCIGGIFIYQVYTQNQSATPGAPTQPVAQPTQAPPIIIFPTQPPPVTQVLPTSEPNPTRPPLERPTSPPEQPTQPAEQPPQVEQPTPPPAQGTPGTGSLPCGSVGLIVAPMVVLGASRLTKKRRL